MKNYSKYIYFIQITIICILLSSCSKSIETGEKNLIQNRNLSQNEGITLACNQIDDNYKCFPVQPVIVTIKIDILGPEFEDCPIIARYNRQWCRDNTSGNNSNYYIFTDFGFAIPESDERCTALWDYLESLTPEEKQDVLDKIYLEVREKGVDSLMYRHAQVSGYYCHNHREELLRASLIEATCYYKCEDLIAIEHHPDFPGPGFRDPDKIITRQDTTIHGLYRYYKHQPCGEGCCINTADYCAILCDTPWDLRRTCGFKRRNYSTHTYGVCVHQAPRSGGCPPPDNDQGCIQHCEPFKWWRHN